MNSPKVSIIDGTGSASWIFYIIIFGVFLYLFLPKENAGMVGVLTGAFVAQKLESNSLKMRIRMLESSVLSA